MSYTPPPLFVSYFGDAAKYIIGYDEPFNILDGAQDLLRQNISDPYPPSNIRKLAADPTKYVIEFLVPGFANTDISVAVNANNVLTVSGVANVAAANTGDDFIIQGIVARDFTKHYALAASIKVLVAAVGGGYLRITVKNTAPVVNTAPIVVT